MQGALGYMGSSNSTPTSLAPTEISANLPFLLLPEMGSNRVIINYFLNGEPERADTIPHNTPCEELWRVAKELSGGTREVRLLVGTPVPKEHRLLDAFPGTDGGVLPVYIEVGEATVRNASTQTEDDQTPRGATGDTTQTPRGEMQD